MRATVRAASLSRQGEIDDGSVAAARNEMAEPVLQPVEGLDGELSRGSNPPICP